MGARAARNARAPVGRLIAEDDERRTHDEGLVQKALAEAAKAASARMRTKDILRFLRKKSGWV